MGTGATFAAGDSTAGIGIHSRPRLSDANFDHSHTAGTAVAYCGGKRDESGCPSSAQRLTCTIARMPNRCALTPTRLEGMVACRAGIGSL